MKVRDEVFGTNQAAEFCGLSPAGFKAHLYTIRDLKPSLVIGRTLAFYRSDLDAFLARKRPAHRPAQNHRPHDSLTGARRRTKEHRERNQDV